MVKEKIRRPNRRLSLPRELYTLMEEICYFQAESISTEQFIQEILMEVGRYYGDKMRETAIQYRGCIVGDYLERTKMLNNPEDNNRFFEGVNI